MSLLDENIEIPFESLLIGNGWKKELVLLIFIEMD